MDFFFILTPISAIDKFKYKLPYKDIFGGVSAMSTKDFKKVNGYSNKFWGWGGEDDDMRQRIKSAGLGKKTWLWIPNDLNLHNILLR